MTARNDADRTPGGVTEARGGTRSTLDPGGARDRSRAPRRSRRVPLAWLNLTYQGRRSLAAFAAIAGAVVLMCVEYGFLNAVYDSHVALIEELDADLFVTGSSAYSLTVSAPFSRRRLYQALAVEAVEEAVPLYVQTRALELLGPETRQRRTIRVLAFPPAQRAFASDEVEAHRATLAYPDTALLDRRSKRHLGRLAVGDITEVAGQDVRIVGRFTLGTDFVNDGSLIMSDTNLMKLSQGARGARTGLDRVDVGLLRLAPGARARDVQQALIAMLQDDVRVRTRAELIAHELRYWRDSTIVGYVFGLAMLVAFVVGVVICYQILFTTVTDLLPQFATLRAMGQTDRYVVTVVFQQALWLSVVGFVAGVGGSLVVYSLVGWITGLPMLLTVPRAALVFVLSVGMSVTAGVIAARKALSTDPADVFG